MLIMEARYIFCSSVKPSMLFSKENFSTSDVTIVYESK